MHETEYDVVIAEFIRSKGVTRMCVADSSLGRRGRSR
jgi:hypothetical protein